jgi:hypothetical protein
MNNGMTKTYLLKFSALFFSALLIYWAGNPSAVAAGPDATLTLTRVVDTDDLFTEDFFSAGHPGFPGVGFPPGANTLLNLNPGPGAARLILVAPPKPDLGKNAGMPQRPIEVADPINLAFDSVSQGASGFGLSRLFLLDDGELIAVKAGARNVMNPDKIKRLDAQGFGIADPQGMTLEPASGRLFVLDGAGPRLVSIQPKPGREFAGAEVTPITLPGELGDLRGLAFNPEDGHLYALSAERRKLYKLTLEGELAASLDLSGLNIGTPQGMVFGPSLDRTDHPSIYHLYLVTANGPKGEVSEWELPGPF